MNQRKNPRAEPDIFTIRQEEPQEPVPKRTRLSLIPPSTTPPVLPLTRDRRKRIDAREQRKRDAMIWSNLVAPFSMDGVEEGGGPSAQSNPLPVVDEEEEL